METIILISKLLKKFTFCKNYLKYFKLKILKNLLGV